jgi:predicted DNA-binding protein
MTKNERIGVRLPAEMKRTLSQIARKEGRSLAQICEIFLRGGIASYRKEGAKHLKHFLSRQKKEADR